MTVSDTFKSLSNVLLVLQATLLVSSTCVGSVQTWGGHAALRYERTFAKAGTSAHRHAETPTGPRLLDNRTCQSSTDRFIGRALYEPEENWADFLALVPGRNPSGPRFAPSDGPEHGALHPGFRPRKLYLQFQSFLC